MTLGERDLLEALRHVNDALIVVDRDLVVVDANDRVETLYGYAPEELVGKPLATLRATDEIPAGDLVHAREELDRIGGIVYEAENRKKDGSVFPVEVSVRKVVVTDTVYHVATIRDITHRKAVERALAASERTTRTILDASPRSAFLLDRDLRLVAVNRKLGERVALAPKDLVGTKGSDLLPPQLAGPADERSRRVFETGEPDRWVSEVGDRFIETSLHPVFGADGTVGLVAGFSSDVTESVELERQKADFVSMFAHDLRGPLTAIVGNTHLLAREEIASEPAARDAAVSRILARSRDMTAMLEDLMAASHAEAATLELELEDTDLGSVVSLAAERVTLSPDHSLEVDVQQDLPHIRADSRRLAHALDNLLNNAVKYSPQGGAIRIAARRADGMVEISVSDEGLGISRPDLVHIFERFRQVRSPADAPRAGFGLGLYIVKSVVEAHGGRVGAKSEVGRGSTFTIALPLDPMGS